MANSYAPDRRVAQHAGSGVPVRHDQQPWWALPARRRPPAHRRHREPRVPVATTRPRLAGVTRRLLAVHAHPDDESITMGGTLAAAAASGVEVTLVTCTLGEEGEVIGDDAAGLVAAMADQLGGFRWWELRHALRAAADLRPPAARRGRAYRDSGMAGTPSADHPRAFVRAAAGGPDHERAVGDLLQVIDAGAAGCRPRVRRRRRLRPSGPRRRTPGDAGGGPTRPACPGCSPSSGHVGRVAAAVADLDRARGAARFHER